jgi:hypothetical protein
MAKRNIINLLGNSNIGKELKRALSFMLLSRGYTAEEIKVLDDYDFSVSKRAFRDTPNIIQDGSDPHRRRKQRSLPKNPVCLTSTSEAYNKRDHTLYSLNGHEPVTKGRLVWSVVKLYQEIFSPTFEEASLLFNQELDLLGYTVIDEASLAALRPDRQKRFYYHESDFIVSKDGIRYAVSNQWAISKMDAVVSFAQNKGWEVEVIKPEIR